MAQMYINDNVKKKIDEAKGKQTYSAFLNTLLAMKGRKPRVIQRIKNCHYRCKDNVRDCATCTLMPCKYFNESKYVKVGEELLLVELYETRGRGHRPIRGHINTPKVQKKEDKTDKALA